MSHVSALEQRALIIVCVIVTSLQIWMLIRPKSFSTMMRAENPSTTLRVESLSTRVASSTEICVDALEPFFGRGPFDQWSAARWHGPVLRPPARVSDPFPPPTAFETPCFAIFDGPLRLFVHLLYADGAVANVSVAGGDEARIELGSSNLKSASFVREIALTLPIEFRLRFSLSRAFLLGFRFCRLGERSLCAAGLGADPGIGWPPERSCAGGARPIATTMRPPLAEIKRFMQNERSTCSRCLTCLRAKGAREPWCPWGVIRCNESLATSRAKVARLLPKGPRSRVASLATDPISAPSFEPRVPAFSEFGFETCALVGSSGILLRSGLGPAIDSATAVFRVNVQRIAGLEADVGARTDYWIMNSQYSPAKIAEDYLGRELRDSSVIYLPTAVKTRAVDIAFAKLVEASRAFNLSIHPLRRQTAKWRDKKCPLETMLIGPHRCVGGSTGEFSVYIALGYCRKVHLYGFLGSVISPAGEIPSHFYPRDGRWLNSGSAYTYGSQARSFKIYTELARVFPDRLALHY